MDGTTLAETVAKYPWYHTLDLGQGVVTRGMFDHRGSEHKYLIPEDTTGLRCLDVGTMDGFWAFEMEKRGSTEVVAVDLEDPNKLDWPASLRDKVEKSLDETKETRFNLARDCLNSKVDRRLVSVYDLDPAELGTFDLVFCGDLLVHLKDPVTAVERIRGVCRGRAIVCTPIIRPRFMRTRTLAWFDGIDEFQWWVFSGPALKRLIRAAGFADVDAYTEFEMPARTGDWKGLRGVVRGRV